MSFLLCIRTRQRRLCSHDPRNRGRPQFHSIGKKFSFSSRSRSRNREGRTQKESGKYEMYIKLLEKNLSWLNGCTYFSI